MASQQIKRKTLFLLNKYYVYIVIILVLFCLGSGYWFFIKDKVAEIKKVGIVDLKSKEDELASKQATLDKLSQLQKQYDQITRSQVAQLDDVLPKAAEIPYLVIEIQNFIKENNLQLTSIDVGPLGGTAAGATAKSAGTGIVSELKITLGISGVDSYFTMKNFLDKLGTNLPLLELTSLVYTPGNESYTLNLTTYYQ